jgi:hypothetical protein
VTPQLPCCQSLTGEHVWTENAEHPEYGRWCRNCGTEQVQEGFPRRTRPGWGPGGHGAPLRETSKGDEL